MEGGGVIHDHDPPTPTHFLWCSYLDYLSLPGGHWRTLPVYDDCSPRLARKLPPAPLLLVLKRAACLLELGVSLLLELARVTSRE